MNRVEDKKSFVTLIVIPHNETGHTHHYKFLRWKLYTLIGVIIGLLSLLPLSIVVYEYRVYSVKRKLTSINNKFLDETEKMIFYKESLKELDMAARRYTHIQPFSLGGNEDANNHIDDSTAISITPPLQTPMDVFSDDYIKKLIGHYTELQKIMDGTPSIWPVKQGGDQIISSTFGWRISPVSHKKIFHEGIDITCAEGTPVISTADGTVLFSGMNGEYGNSIVVQHEFNFSTVYAHDRINFVKRGDSVKRGQIIGEIGNTGNSTGPHLHYEIRINNRQVNPWKYMF